MVSAMSPMLGYESRLQAALAKQKRSAPQPDQLPAYSEATKGNKLPIQISEKEVLPEPQKSSKLAALKRAFKPLDPERSSSVDSSGSSNSSSSTSSTFKQILTGEVYRYHPMYRLEAAAMASSTSRSPL